MTDRSRLTRILLVLFVITSAGLVTGCGKKQVGDTCKNDFQCDKPLSNMCAMATFGQLECTPRCKPKKENCPSGYECTGTRSSQESGSASTTTEHFCQKEGAGMPAIPKIPKMP